MGCPSVHPSICQAVLFLLPSDRPSARLLFVSRSDRPPANPSARPPDRHSRQLSALPSARRKVTHVCTNVRPSYCPCAWLSDEATDRPSVRPRRTAIFSSPSPSSLSPIGPSVPSSDRPSDQPTERHARVLSPPVRLPSRPDRPTARPHVCPTVWCPSVLPSVRPFHRRSCLLSILLSFQPSVRPYLQPSDRQLSARLAVTHVCCPRFRPSVRHPSASPSQPSWLGTEITGTVQFEPAPKKQSAQTQRKSRAGIQQKCCEQSFRRHSM